MWLSCLFQTGLLCDLKRSRLTFRKKFELSEEKQSPGGVLQKSALKNLAKFTWEHLCQSLFSAILYRTRTPFFIVHFQFVQWSKEIIWFLTEVIHLEQDYFPVKCKMHTWMFISLNFNMISCVTVTSKLESST